ncbi:MAG TPA: dATP/dGTP diphosphohydrolase domain-containing protein [Candidatus Paceibacterota bacterium]
MEFIVKDSGKREEYPTGMRRDTQDGKPRYDLTIPENMQNNMLKRFAIHMAKGAVKYGERNWELASTPEEAKRFRASAFRHFMQWFNGDVDEDHAAAIYFNVQCFEYVKERLDGIQESEKRVVQSVSAQSHRRSRPGNAGKSRATRKNGKARRS